MEVSYKKNLEKSYLLIKTETELEDDYKMKMAYRNVIPGFCKVSVKNLNNGSTLYYDITQKISLTNLYGRKQMLKKDIRRYVFGIQKAIESAREYLLDMDKILLDFDFVYADLENGGVSFCYYPLKEEDFFESLRRALTDMIRITDHTDRETVIMSYGIQQLATNENITIGDILKFLKDEQFQEDSEDDEFKLPYDYEEATEETRASEDGNKTNLDELKLNTTVAVSKMEQKKNDSVSTKGFWNKIKNLILGQQKREIFTLSELEARTSTNQEINQLQSRQLPPQQSQHNQLEQFKRPQENCQESNQLGNNQLGNYHLDNKQLQHNQPSNQKRRIATGISDEVYKDNNTFNCEYDDIDDDATVMLKLEVPSKGIVLQSVDIDNPIPIIPKEYPCIIGKSKRSSDWVLEDTTVSRVHARIDERNGEFYIEDLNSSNGTCINGEKIKPHIPHNLVVGDRILFANLEYIVE